MAGKVSEKTKKRRKTIIVRIVTIAIAIVMVGSILLVTLLPHWY